MAAETPAQMLARHDSVLRAIRAGVQVPGRRTASAPAAVAAVVGGYADLGGPTLMVLVRGGEVSVTASARLVSSGGRLSMGWTLAGPYLDEAMTASPDETPAATVAADDSRALSVNGTEVTASFTYNQTGLAPGWYAVTAVYALSAGTGTATYRQLIANPT